MPKIKRPPKGKWKIGDVASFGGVIGRIVANDPALGGHPLYWITTEPGLTYGSGKMGMVVKFDLEGKFSSWHREPLLAFVRRPTKKELQTLTADQAKATVIEVGHVSGEVKDGQEGKGSVGSSS